MSASPSEAVAPNLAYLGESERLEIVYVPLERLHPNPWNPNKMNPRTYEAARESIRTYGFIDPSLVRPHPMKSKKLVGEGGTSFSDTDFQVLDGEHRTRAATDEGLTVLPVTPLHGLSDADAKKLTVILNETRGDADLLDLGRLLASLGGTPEEVGVALPYSTRELEELLRVGSQDWEDFGGGAPPVLPPPRTSGKSITLGFGDEDYERFTLYLTTLSHEWQTEGIEATVMRALQEAADRVRGT